MASYLQNILLGNNYVGIECFSVNNEEQYAFLQVNRKKGSLETAEKDIFKNTDALATVKSKLPAVLIINNSYVLQKEVMSTDSNDKKLVHKSFPNIKLDDFYYEIWRRETSSVIAVCRRSYVDEQINILGKYFRITGISLGVCSLSTVSGFINTPSIITNTHQVNTSETENSLLPLTSTENVVYNVNGLAVESSWIVSFGSVLGIILGNKTSGSITDLRNTVNESFKQKAFFEKTLQYGIGLILGLLLINFLLFSHYFKKANNADVVLSANKVEIEKINQLKKRIKNKEDKLQSFAGNTASRSSLLINKITSSLPASISLNEFIYHPIERRIKEGKTIQPQDSIITVSGSLLSNQEFTDWVSDIERLNEVSNVTITAFGKENKKTTFSVSIATK
ncbi:general secretion pathway protein [Flavobacterium litorale]|uniref:General secretion pathway protein n=1 Tax=Flavobacterium litorale TaxID=2856519 RepID=A0ABX8V705_9FLAO|nr:general secretion pathway protein [Flavobacterium litorale]QYJ68267.1 general secretion pathway protein [Flavobacterium litorale]